MIDTGKIKELLEIREDAGENDNIAAECREAIVRSLGDDEDEIVEYLDSLPDDDLYLMSESFQDIAENLNSDTFCDKLWLIQDNHPDINMADSILAADL